MANPLDAYKKALKKRQREKRSSEKAEAKEAQQLLQNPDALKKELDELNHKAVIGRISEDALARRDKLEGIWTDYCERKTRETLAYIAQAQSNYDLENNSQESETESSSDDDDENDQKCIIEIGGRPLEISKKPKRVAPSDDKSFNTSTVPSGSNDSKSAMGSVEANVTSAADALVMTKTRNALVWSSVPQASNVKVTIPPPPPPSPATSPIQFKKRPNAKVAPSVKSQALKIHLPKPKEPQPEPEPVPLSKYLVPSQLRHKK